MQTPSPQPLPHQLPLPLFNALLQASVGSRWGILFLVLASFATLGPASGAMAPLGCLVRMGRFEGELLHWLPRYSWRAGQATLRHCHVGSGTLIAAVLGLLLALASA